MSERDLDINKSFRICKLISTELSWFGLVWFGLRYYCKIGQGYGDKDKHESYGDQLDKIFPIGFVHILTIVIKDDNDRHEYSSKSISLIFKEDYIFSYYLIGIIIYERFHIQLNNRVIRYKETNLIKFYSYFIQISD